MTTAALASALLLAGCSSAGTGEAGAEQSAAPSREVLLQAAGAQAPDAFTASTVQEGAPAPSGTAPAGIPGSPVPPAREVGGATPGLYAGTRSLASCNVTQQVALLTAEPARARSFAEAAGIPESGVTDWLRGLTPVLLRADTRVTDHGYRDGRATAFQSVLQAGTAVLVDQYGTPRVRCACGSPLRAPSTGQGAVHTGKPWPGYAPDRVVAITPTSTVVTSLVIASLADNTWLDRRTGSHGDEDRRPDVLPPCDPASCDPATAPAAPLPDTQAPQAPADPRTPAQPQPYTTPQAPDRGGRTTAPVPDPTVPAPDAPRPDGPAPDAPTPGLPMPDAPHDLPPDFPSAEPPPSFEELFPNDPAAQQPETFEG